MMWVLVAYISIGLWLLMPGLVFAWDSEKSHWSIKVVGSIVAVLLWPLVFTGNV